MPWPYPANWLGGSVTIFFARLLAHLGRSHSDGDASGD
ncbi:hypothetical protein ASZ90_002470 [hydrocarbon metagenome]|uniref:Uncharacterized protein n=1 Tax=hydrocarbon metagenome TaxID=938273 RepID=A0A0W8G5B1_9ZZZZ